ncbi:MAG: hypothetical protein ACJ79E_17460, partial [Anaeromyxobacteraceae bacterium]
SVTIDFDGKKSIQTHPTGSGEEWILRPVIRVRATAQDDVGCGGDTGGTGGEQPPVLVPAGGACTANPECFSGSCVQNFCAGGANGAPCHASTDCLSNVCGEDATCAAPPDAAGAGASCVDDSGCLSNACVGGVCDPGDQGAVCKSETDCRAGLLSCNQGSCEPLAAL